MQPPGCGSTLLLTTSDSLQNLVDQVSQHRMHCNAQLHLDLNGSSGHPANGMTGTGHTATFVWTCIRKHHLSWDTSPHLPHNGHSLVDYRVAHAYFSTGLLPVQYD